MARHCGSAETSAAKRVRLVLQARSLCHDQPAPVPTPHVPQVSGEAIRAMAPGQAAEVNALRNAFGSDYEAKLRQEAGAHSPAAIL